MAVTTLRTPRTAGPAAALRDLAALYGVTTAFDGLHGRQQADRAAVLAVLSVLGAPLASLRDAPDALRAARQQVWARGIEPVIVAWSGAQTTVTLRQRAAQAEQPLDCTLQLDGGKRQRWRVEPGELGVVETAEVEGTAYVARKLRLPARLPSGYHRLQLKTRGGKWETWVFAAPRRAYTPPTDKAPAWGAFLPLYALRTARDSGCGDFTDLRALADWTLAQGGRALGALPLLAAFLDDEPYEYSPYAPVSRRAWNELYVDPTRLPEFQTCSAAQELAASPAWQAEQARLRALDEVDYRAVQALKRPVLALLAEELDQSHGERRAAFEAFLDAHPLVGDYARFRAATERAAAPWTAWAEPRRGGTLTEADYDAAAWRYHAYGQWSAHEQLGALAAHLRGSDARLYLDLPLGVHPEGYDVWRERDAFASGATGGAPPDMFFTGGQNWGFPPLHPEGIRRQGYRYFIEAVRHHLQFANVLRIDHVMGFHRLYWIPTGFTATDGVYVRYQPEEFYAVLSIESHRHQAAIVGEDLGIVQPAVREQMARHNVARMYVGMYEIRPTNGSTLAPVPPGAVGSVGTHDMPTWQSWWTGRDIAQRQTLGLLDAAALADEHTARARARAALVRFLGHHRLLPFHLPWEEIHWDGDRLWLTGGGGHGAAQSVLSGLLGWLAMSAAPLVMVNLEDLWFEPRPQNVPGTWQEQPNWRRKAAHPLEALACLPEPRAILAGLARQRAAAAGSRGGEQT